MLGTVLFSFLLILAVIKARRQAINDKKCRLVAEIK